MGTRPQQYYHRNERADALAKAAAEITIDNPPISLSHEKSQSRQQNRGTNSSMSIVNGRFAPTLKPHEHSIHTSRNLYGRLIQCRTGHAFGRILHYTTPSMSQQKIASASGEPIQSRGHILTSCLTYENQYHILKDALSPQTSSAPRTASRP